MFPRLFIPFSIASLITLGLFLLMAWMVRAPMGEGRGPSHTIDEVKMVDLATAIVRRETGHMMKDPGSIREGRFVCFSDEAGAIYRRGFAGLIEPGERPDPSTRIH